MRKIVKIVVLAGTLAAGVGVGLMGNQLLQLMKRGSQMINPWDQTEQGTWPSGYRMVSIDTEDGNTQNAMFLSSNDIRPLIVSLHTWSGTYAQNDPLAQEVIDIGWNYIRPDMRGPNNNPESCLSELALSDFDRAIEFALQNGNVDDQHIYVVGASGGGYAALGAYLMSRQPISHFFVWVPITDLEAWYFQSTAKGTRYSNDILLCTDSKDELNTNNARLRSPLHWPLEGAWEPRPLSIFAGIDDGHTGSVPISHSINFYNRLATHLSANEIDPTTMASLLTRGLPASDIMLDDRRVFLARSVGPIDITIFEGGHEMLASYQLARLISSAR